MLKNPNVITEMFIPCVKLKFSTPIRGAFDVYLIGNYQALLLSSIFVDQDPSDGGRGATEKFTDSFPVMAHTSI